MRLGLLFEADVDLRSLERRARDDPEALASYLGARGRLRPSEVRGEPVSRQVGRLRKQGEGGLRRPPRNWRAPAGFYNLVDWEVEIFPVSAQLSGSRNGLPVFSLTYRVLVDSVEGEVGESFSGYFVVYVIHTGAVDPDELSWWSWWGVPDEWTWWGYDTMMWVDLPGGDLVDLPVDLFDALVDIFEYALY